MKRTRTVITNLLVIFATAICVANADAATKIKLFILSGQSNAAGIAFHGIPLLPPELQQQQKNVKFYYAFKQGNVSGWTSLRPGVGTELGCEDCDVGSYVTAGHDLAAALPNDSIALYLMADGGSTLASNWRPPSSGGTTGPDYLDLANQCKAAITALGPNYEVEIAGMMWLQGESDSNDKTAADAYKTNLTNLIHDIRTFFNVPRMPFMIGLVDTVLCWLPSFSTVRQAEMDVAASIPNVGFTDPKGFPKINGDEDIGSDGPDYVPESGDPGHYNPLGHMVLGSDLAAGLLRLLKNPVPGAFVEPSDLVAVAVANGQVKLTWRDNSTTETGFVLERKTGAGAYAQLATPATGAGLFATFTDNSVMATTQYTYRVKAVNGATSSAYSNEALIVPFGAGTGLKAEYYSDTTFTNLAFTRTDSAISFNWDGKSPGAGIPAGSKFSVRWTGSVEVKHTENCTFFVNSDQFGTVWVNNQKIADPLTYLYRWGGGDPLYKKTRPIHCGSIQLTAGQVYPIKVEYHTYPWLNGEWPPNVYLSWKTSTSQDMQIIPKSQLHATATATPNRGDSKPRAQRAGMISVVSTNLGTRLDLAGADKALSVVVTDVRGRAVRAASVNGSATIDLAAAGRGVYFVSVNKEGSTAADKFIVQR